MAQLFLYLTLFLAASAGADTGYPANADGLLDSNVVCMDQARANAANELDSPEEDGLAAKSFTLKPAAKGCIATAQYFLYSAYRTHNSIRAPPFFLS
mgnify:CR=1 FL=1